MVDNTRGEFLGDISLGHPVLKLNVWSTEGLLRLICYGAL